MMDGWGWGWGLMMVPMMLIFWAVPIALVVWGLTASGVVRGRGGREDAPPSRATEPSAEEIVARRYARGELSDDEFAAMRRRLSGTDAVAGAAAGASRDAVRPGT
jgi:putative membrane protein